MSASARLASYVPNLVQRRLAEGGFAQEPCRRTEHGVLLLGDIVGSTSIVQHVAQRGALAVEALTANLNEVFSVFVDHICEQGGDVLFIAGDAFLCHWPEHRATPRESVRRATVAGLRIQRDMHDRHDGYGNSVQFRVGIGAGELTHLFVGGVNGRWEPFLAGEAFEQVVQAERGAASGAVQLSPKAVELVATEWCQDGIATPDADLHWQDVDIDGLADSAPVAGELFTELDEQQLGPFLPPAVSRRKLLPSDGWLHEVRTVSVVLASVPGFHLHRDDEVDHLHRVVGSFQSIANRLEASMRVDADDKGPMLFAVFGAPPLAHEDDSVRAINAAWELASTLSELGITTGIGIASGRALCVPLGNDRRREFMVRGNVTNRAARLMHATNDQIACDETTVLLARHAIEFEALPNHLVKGLDEALNVGRPVGVRQAISRNQRDIIGRQAYLDRLKSALFNTEAHADRRTILIRGEPGLGKTSLVDALALQASNSGVRVLRAGAQAVEKSTPWFALRSLFSELFGLTRHSDIHTSRERVSTQMQHYPDLYPLTPLLGPVVGIEFEQTDATQYLEGDTRAAQTTRLLVSLLQQFVRSDPSLLIIEDAHWLDSRTSAFVAEVSHALASALVVITSRPVDGSAPEIVSAESTECLDLTVFDQHEIQQLIARRVGVSKVPDSLTRLIHERSGGNPFFAEQIVHEMIDSGVLGAEYGDFKLENLQSMTIPPTVEGMVLGRLDRLSEQQAVLLKTASIAGQQFVAQAVLESVQVPVDRSSAAEDFAALTSAGFLDPAGRDGQLRFRHAITREVTYASMTNAQQVAGHSAFAAWLEDNQGSSWVNAPLIAHHQRAAGNISRALELTETAGRRAIFGGAFQEALSLCAAAKELGAESGQAANPVRAAAWDYGLGTAHYFLGDLQTSRRYLEAVVKALDRPVPANKLKATPSTLAGALRQWWFRRRNEQGTMRCAPADKPMYDMMIDTYKTLGQIYFIEGEPAELLVYLTLRGLELGEVAGPSPAFACVLINMSVTTSLAQLDRVARWYSDRAHDMVERDSCRSAAAYVAHIDALRYAQHGAWQSALQANDQAFLAMKTLGDRTLATEAGAVRSALLLCAGDICAARQVVAQAREDAVKSNNPQYLCWALLDGVEIELAASDTAGARAWLDQALAIPTEPADLSSLLDKSRAQALVKIREGDTAGAVESATVVIKTIADYPPTSYYFLDFYASAIDVLIDALEQWPDDAELQGVITNSLKRLKKLSATFWNVKPRYWLLRGRFAAAQGSDAAKDLATAYETATALNMPFDQACAYAGQLNLGYPPTGNPEQIIAVLDQLGQTRLAASIRR